MQRIQLSRELAETRNLAGLVSNPFANLTVRGSVDRKLESWKAGSMKVTLELPGNLVREMKLQAAQEGRKLKDVAEQIFRRGLVTPRSANSARRKSKLPLIECEHAASSATEITPERVADLLLMQDSEQVR
jgi:hypothetical protein